MTNITFTARQTLQITATTAFIQEAHRGQKYNDMPYFFHPVEVADEVIKLIGEELGLTTFAPVSMWVVEAALLHDVIEDTDYTADQLRDRFCDKVVDAVELLTLDLGLPYLENIQRIIDSGNETAMFVKLCDNRVNRRGDKSSFKPEKAQRLNDRYDASMVMLKEALYERGYRLNE